VSTCGAGDPPPHSAELRLPRAAASEGARALGGGHRGPPRRQRGRDHRPYGRPHRWPAARLAWAASLRRPD